MKQKQSVVSCVADRRAEAFVYCKKLTTPVLVELYLELQTVAALVYCAVVFRCLREVGFTLRSKVLGAFAFFWFGIDTSYTYTPLWYKNASIPRSSS